MDLNGRLGAIVDKRTGELLELRRTLHQHPELAFEEHETAKAVSGFLNKLGIPHKTGIGRTGIVAVLEGSRPGRTIGIRADMDALPITEETGLPFASKNPGKMHACGHDVHTVIALGVAATLSEMRDVLPGRIKFIFQPAEESLLGALAMIKDGVLDEQPKLDALLGYHNWPPLKAGTVGYHPENVMSSADVFDVIIKGRVGHAAHPHLAIDALAAAAYFVTQVQTVISREIAPLSPAVISIGEMHAGTARNVVAGSAELKGSVRTQEPGLSEKIEAAVRRLLDGIEKGMRVEAILNWQKGVPVLRNDKAVLERVLNVARDTLGAENVINLNQASMGSEDLAWFAEKVPTAHLRIGSKIDGLDTAIHRSNYDCHDLTIPTGVKVMARAALDLAKA